ncbi:probable glycosyltransferase STELLO2 [Selaginella moellendorffii]|uniref:probable glycosyltransferase STELLO2 n=1 Tax=Selaginella moellendorffii TaxID=88036 RepID=UPI000D1C5543|nr:probable glycosyltransferase STELLO2 [Selaginella moellendorffii]|eukprot:XP_024517750.1 probable glycosyltransferase STELLO2 [Selaginella moellendorffii]
MYVQDRIDPSSAGNGEARDGSGAPARNGVHFKLDSNSTTVIPGRNEEDFEGSEESEVEEDTERRPILPAPSSSPPEPSSSIQSFVVENFPKIVIGLFVFLSAIVFLMVRSRGDNAVLSCIESASRQREEIPYPRVDLEAASAKVDKGILKSEKWIVVAVSGAPSEEIQQLAKLDGWQLLALGNSQTPTKWEVPGAIFLSKDAQAGLNFRVQSHIDPDGPARKNVGYLFAIQHGARKIYDADETIIVRGGNLEKVFDVELSGTSGRREPLYQYRMVENRTIVNPYVHFGQRSMWPRGFPVRMVGETSLEVAYNEIAPGRHFIQQGLANGFADVDALFYYTRRSEREALSIEFDLQAPPVALPQGTMAPVSSVNTLFHSPALWSLMIPADVSSRAADVVRGYWAQRLLWEVGGMLVVFPPTAHRVDQLDPILLKDEKDLHKMERLINFVVSWRSDKRSLFQRILHLSHSMAENGYWSAQNVDLTVAWLQDLVSVGYRQPRMLALELGRVDPLLYNSEHVQFVPETLPSVYLGIHESSQLEKEMGDWLKWRRYFGNIVLVLDCSPDANATVLAWRMFYSRLFKHVEIRSRESNAGLRVEGGNFTYQSLPEVFDRYPHADGYLYLKDDAVFNYWNFVTSNKNKLWSLQKSRTAIQPKTTWQVIGFKRPGSAWYLASSVKKSIKAAVRSLSPKMLANYKKSMDDMHFVVSSSDSFYIPHRYVSDFKALVPIGVKLELRPELAIPLFFLAMEKPASYDSEAFKYVAETSVRRDPAVFYRKSKHLVRPWSARNVSEIVRRIRALSVGDPLLVEIL